MEPAIQRRHQYNSFTADHKLFYSHGMMSGWLVALPIISVLLLLLALFSKSRRRALVLAQVAATVFGLGVFEAYLAFQKAAGDGTRMEGTITAGFKHSDDLLGYAPNKDTRVTARKFHGNSLIYDVAYTIGPNGLRISPPAKAAGRGCMIFFGDSITFGEGVRDEESFPYQVGIKTGGDYAVYNFAFSGYGPHQMLADLQARREEIVDCTPTHFIYLCIPEHVERVAGLAAWDQHGPRFRLTTGGKVIRDGNFDSPDDLSVLGTIDQRIKGALDEFLTWQKLFGGAREAGSADLTLLTAVIREAARTAQERYPRSKFHVLLWDGSDNERVRAIESGLHAAGTPVHRETKAIPDFRANWRQYVLSEYDLHPNPRQLERLADYVARSILGGDDADAQQSLR